MYVQGQDMSIVVTQQADKATWNLVTVVKCQDQTATVCGVRLQTVQEMQW